jgi:hypothetical protein
VEDIGRTAKREHGNTAAKTGHGTESYQAGDDDETTAGTMGRLEIPCHSRPLPFRLFLLLDRHNKLSSLIIIARLLLVSSFLMLD